MDSEYWLPKYLEYTTYGASMKEWNKRCTNPHVDVTKPQSLPSKLKKQDCDSLSELMNDALEIKFIGYFKRSLLQTDNPIPPFCEIYYFEAQVISLGDLYKAYDLYCDGCNHY